MTLCQFFAIVGIVVTVTVLIGIALFLSQLTLDDNMKPYKPWRRS